MDRAVQAMSSGGYRAALVELKGVLDHEPGDARALMLASEALLKVGDAEAAQRELQAASRAGAAQERVAVLQAQIYLAQGRATDLLHDSDSPASNLSEPMRSILRGDAFFLLHRYAEATSEFRAALAVGPASIEAHVGLAEVLTFEGSLDQARSALDALEPQISSSAAAWRVRAAIFGRSGQTAQAVRALENAQRYAAGQLRLPEQAMVLDSLAEARLNLGDLAGAQAAFRDLQKVAPGAPLTRYLDARVAMAQGSYARASTELEKLVASSPMLLQPRCLFGKALLAQGRLGEADRELTELLSQAPNHVEARKLLATVRMRRGWASGAIATLTPVVGAVQNDPALGELLSVAQMRAGDESAAVATLERTVVANPASTSTQLLLIAAYFKSGSLAKAFAHIDQLVAEHPRDPVTLNQVAAFLKVHYEFDRAEAVLRQALAATPGDVTAQLEQAESAMRRGQDSTAEEILEHLCRADGSAIQPRLALANLYLQQRKESAADRLIRELLERAPRQARVLNFVGLLYLQNGSFEAATAKFRAAIDLEPTNAVYRANLSSAQLALNHIQEATDAGAKALVIDPDSVPAIRALTLIDLRTNRSDAALARILAAEAEHFDDAVMWELEGDVRVSLKQYQQASVAFDRASGLGAPAAVAVKSFQARREGGLSKVASPLEHWVAQQPGDTVTRRVLAQFYRSSGRTFDAVREYEAIVATERPDMAVLNNLAWLYQRTGDGRAVATARRAYEMSPTTPAVADTYGWALVQAGQVRNGLRLLDSAAKSAAADGDIRFHYAAALARNGDRERAREALVALLAENALSDRSEAERLLRQL